MKNTWKKRLASIVIALGILVGSLGLAPAANAATLGKICVQGGSEAGVSYRNYGTTQAWSYVSPGSCVYIASKKQVAHGQGVMILVNNGLRFGPGASVAVSPPVTSIFYVDR